MWISVKDRLPEKDTLVLVIANGKPCKNVTLADAYQLASYSEDEGWILDEFPEAEGIAVAHWMPLPEPPEEGK